MGTLVQDLNGSDQKTVNSETWQRHRFKRRTDEVEYWEAAVAHMKGAEREGGDSFGSVAEMS